MRKRPTILDVAKHAGVSKSTVSLVLQSSTLVKESTRQLVEAAMADLSYVRNRSAAHLRGASSGLIGLVINDLRNPFFTEFAASAQMAFARKGFATVIANTDEDPDMQVQVIESMIEHGVSAFVICPTYGGDADTFERIERAHIPTMQVLRQIDDRTGVFPFLTYDYAEGSAEATRHLLSLGCRNIAFVGGLQDRPITLERMAGYNEVITGAGHAPHYFPGRPSRELGRQLARTLAEEHPDIDGAMCFSDLVALGMLAGFAELGIRVGHDLRLVGFDDIEEASLSYPMLSSVRCDTAGFGERAAETMLRWIVEGEAPPAEQRAEVQLIARQSSLGVNT